MTNAFPDLPILNQTPPKRSTTEKYGRTFVFLGVGGLLILLLLLARFGFEVAQRWQTWNDIYVLNDPKRDEGERVQAAYRLTETPGALEPGQILELCFSRVPPVKARYLLAESLRDEILGSDPARYADMVARSEEWPNWLRLLLVRPLAYGADRIKFPKDGLDRLRVHPDRSIALWAAYTAAVSLDDAMAKDELKAAAASDEEFAWLADFLDLAGQADDHVVRRALLDDATRMLRRGHPEAMKFVGNEDSPRARGPRQTGAR